MMNNYSINHLQYDSSDVEFTRWANNDEWYPLFVWYMVSIYSLYKSLLVVIAITVL